MFRFLVYPLVILLAVIDELLGCELIYANSNIKRYWRIAISPLVPGQVGIILQSWRALGKLDRCRKFPSADGYAGTNALQSYENRFVTIVLDILPALV